MDTLALRTLTQQDMPVVMRALGQWMAQTRTLRGLRQTDLAEQTGVNLRRLQRMEQVRSVGLDTWLTVVTKLGYLPDLLMAQPKPLTLDQFDALAQGRWRTRKRFRQKSQRPTG